jgi:hypothetical protein
VHKNHCKSSQSQIDLNAIPNKLDGYAVHRHLYRVCVDLETGTQHDAYQEERSKTTRPWHILDLPLTIYKIFVATFERFWVFVMILIPPIVQL